MGFYKIVGINVDPLLMIGWNYILSKHIVIRQNHVGASMGRTVLEHSEAPGEKEERPALTDRPHMDYASAYVAPFVPGRPEAFSASKAYVNPVQWTGADQFRDPESL